MEFDTERESKQYLYYFLYVEFYNASLKLFQHTPASIAELGPFAS